MIVSPLVVIVLNSQVNKIGGEDITLDIDLLCLSQVDFCCDWGWRLLSVLFVLKLH